MAGLVLVAGLALFGVVRGVMWLASRFGDNGTASEVVVDDGGDAGEASSRSSSGGSSASGSGGAEDNLSDEEKLAYIEAHEELYPAYLIKFAQNYPQTIDFVYLYPELDGTTEPIDLSHEAASGIVPRLLQWDSRWGYAHYGDGVLGRFGCGPTCLSMVALYVTGDATYTPLYVAEYAEENGYYVYGVGTAWSLMESGCTGLGMTATTVPLGESEMASQLEAGHPIICAVGAGDFTVAGHFIVLTGYSNGRFTLIDPNNPANSSTTWTFSQLSYQIEGIWAYSKA